MHLFVSIQNSQAGSVWLLDGWSSVWFPFPLILVVIMQDFGACWLPFHKTTSSAFKNPTIYTKLHAKSTINPFTWSVSDNNPFTWCIKKYGELTQWFWCFILYLTIPIAWVWPDHLQFANNFVCFKIHLFLGKCMPIQQSTHLIDAYPIWIVCTICLKKNPSPHRLFGLITYILFIN